MLIEFPHLGFRFELLWDLLDSIWVIFCSVFCGFDRDRVF